MDLFFWAQGCLRMPGGVSYGFVPLSSRMLKDARRCARRCELWIHSLELKDA